MEEDKDEGQEEEGKDVLDDEEEVDFGHFTVERLVVCLGRVLACAACGVGWVPGRVLLQQRLC